MIRAIEPIPSWNIVETLITCGEEKDGYRYMKRVSRSVERGQGANAKYSREQKLQVARYHSSAHLFYMHFVCDNTMIIRSIRQEYLNLDLICCQRYLKNLSHFSTDSIGNCLNYQNIFLNRNNIRRLKYYSKTYTRHCYYRVHTTTTTIIVCSEQ